MSSMQYDSVEISLDTKVRVRLTKRGIDVFKTMFFLNRDEFFGEEVDAKKALAGHRQTDGTYEFSFKKLSAIFGLAMIGSSVDDPESLPFANVFVVLL